MDSIPIIPPITDAELRRVSETLSYASFHAEDGGMAGTARDLAIAMLVVERYMRERRSAACPSS